MVVTLCGLGGGTTAGVALVEATQEPAVEPGHVLGGPVSGDEDDFQRFPSGTKARHAIRLARQNTSRERRRYYQYVIVGAGTTAKAAIETILMQDPEADILMLTDEACLPAGDVYKKDR
ncbi:unnamed protein product [Discosporangium mesarthrocarpum]